MKNVVKKVVLNAPASKVWEAITDSKKLEEWTEMPNNIKPEIGHQFEFIGDSEGKYGNWNRKIRSRVTELEVNKKISFTWQFDLMKGETLVTIELFEKGGITDLILTHSGWEADKAEGDFWRESATDGWRDLLSRLNFMLSGKQNIKLIADTALFWENKTLLIKYRDVNKYDHQKGWFIPDDRIMHGEHPYDASKRILKEQLGLDNIKPKLQFIESFTGGDKSWHLVFHYSITFQNTPVLKPSKDISEYNWFETNVLPDAKEIAHHGWAKYILDEILKMNKQ